jgi:hypothetical protein
VSKAAGVLSIRNRNYFFHCQHLGSPTVFFVLLISYFYFKKFFALYLDPNDACVLSSFFTLISMMPVFFVFVLYLDPNDACVLSSFFTLIPMMPVFCFRSLP